MKRGLDTNVLVYAHIPAFAEHAPVRRFLQGQLAAEDVTLVELALQSSCTSSPTLAGSSLR